MREIIIICKTISASIIRGININKLHLASKLRLETVQSKYIITLNNKVFFDYAVLITLDFTNIFTILSASFCKSLPIYKSLLIKKSVYFIVSKYLIKKYFISLCSLCLILNRFILFKISIYL